MGRKKIRRVPYTLDSKNIKKIPFETLCAILRAADNIIGLGGRTMLTKILKGSKERKLLEYNLDSSPVYGIFHDHKKEEINVYIDWVIKHNYLHIEYDYRLPLIYFTSKGWEIVKQILVNEYLELFHSMITSGADHFNVQFLKDKNREVIFLLLDVIKETKSKEYIPLLEDWALIDYKKIRKRIHHVIHCLKK